MSHGQDGRSPVPTMFGKTARAASPAATRSCSHNRMSGPPAIRKPDVAEKHAGEIGRPAHEHRPPAAVPACQHQAVERQREQAGEPAEYHQVDDEQRR